MEEFKLNEHNKQEWPPMHSAEHLLNGEMARRFGCGRAFSAHIERKKSKLDYHLPKPLTDKYDSGVLTLHELVNELFEPWEQVDESQHSFLAVVLHTAAGGIPTPHVGTGAGGSSSDLPWNDNCKDKFRRPKPKRL